MSKIGLKKLFQSLCPVTLHRLQTGPRGERERQFYQLVFQRLEQELLDGRGEFVFQPLRSLVYSNLPQPEEPWKAALDGEHVTHRS